MYAYLSLESCGIIMTVLLMSLGPAASQNQISFSNGRSIETQESKVTVAGNDLQLIKRVEGEFFEKFELHSFRENHKLERTHTPHHTHTHTRAHTVSRLTALCPRSLRRARPHHHDRHALRHRGPCTHDLHSAAFR